MASPSSSLCSSLASPRAASLGHRRRLAFSSPRKAFQVKASARVDKYSKNDIIVSPSILSANFAKLGDQRQSRCVCKRLSGKFYIGVLLNIHLHADIYDPWNNILVITGWSSFWSDRWNRWKKKREEDEGSNVYNGKQTKRQGKAGGALGDLKSVRELYDFKTLVVLFLIGSVAVVPTILKRKRTYE